MRSRSNRAAVLAATLALLPLCLPAAAEAASPIVALRGKATKLGSVGRASISLSGEYSLGGPIILNRATVTVEAVLDEEGGGGELVAGLPATLLLQPGAKPKTVRYQTAARLAPKMRLDVPEGRTRPESFILNIQQASIDLPELCPPGRGSSTDLTLRFTFNDRLNPPITVEGNFAWLCIGKDPQAPLILQRR